MNVTQQTYEEIEQLIYSETSPVGIDAKKTHVLIIQLLQDIRQRLERLEQKSSNS